MLKLRNLLTAILALALTLSLGSVNAEVRLPHGQYTESSADLRVKVMGGQVEVNRTWFNDKWYFNPDWDALKFTFDNLDGAVQTITRGDAEYKLTSPGVFVQDKRNTIRSTATGYRWQDRQGNWAEFDADGKILKRGDRNDVKISFKYDTAKKLTGVIDHFNTQVLTFEYTGNLLTAIRDYTNRKVQYQYSGNNLTTVIDVLGNAWVYTYDGANKLLTKTDPETRKTTLTYNPTGRIASVKDNDNIGPSYVYDYDKSKAEYYVKETSPLGKVTETWYNQLGQTIRQDVNGKTLSTLLIDGRNYATKDQRGLTTTNEYDEWDNITKVTNADGSTVTNKYDTTYSNLLETTNEIGVTTKFDYDAKGNLTQLTEALGKPEQRVTQYTYDTYGNKLTEKRLSDAVTQEATTTFTYDGYGNVATLTDPETNKTEYTYDVMGNAKTRKDARGKIWTATYDATGQMKSEVNPLGHTLTYEYDKVGNRTKQTDARNNSTTFVYNARNQRIKQTNALSGFTQYEYDAEGKRTKEVDPEGKTQRFEYDLDGRLVKTIDGNSNEVTSLYGDAGSGLDGLITGVKYPTFIQAYTYDTQYRVNQSVDALTATDKRTTTYQYDAVGRQTKVIDPEAKATVSQYDALGRITKIIDSFAGVTELGYDNRDNLILVKDPKGNVTRYGFDRNNRKTEETRPGGEKTLYAYDPNGNLASETDAKGQAKKYAYDDAGRLTQETHNNAQNVVGRTINYGYDASGNLTSYSDGNVSSTQTYDALNRKTSEIINYGAFNLSYSYTYYANGSKKSFTGPDGITYSYTYDGNNQLQTIQLPSGAITVNSYQWFAPTKTTFPGGLTREQTYDPLMRPKSIAVKDASQSSVLNYQYTLDKADNILSKLTEHGEYKYSYDNLYRLTQSVNPTLPQENYTYDAVGNRLTDSQISGNWSYNSNNQLLSYGNVALEYDANGNTIKKIDNGQVTQYVYDVSNRLVEVKDGTNTSIAKYAYDPFGRRIMKEVSGTKTYFLYADEGLVGEFDASGNQIVAYGFEPNSTWTTNPVFQRRNGNYYFYQNDHLGTPQKLVDATGNVVWSMKMTAFGKAEVNPTSTVTSNLRFPGQYFDQETGTQYNFHRDYNPIRGQYVQSDPIGLEGGINRYAYTEGDPISLGDPTGEFAWGVAFAAVNLGYQLYQNGGNLQCVNWVSVGMSMVGGGLLNGLLKGAFRFKSIGSNTWNATRSWMNRQGIMPTAAGQQRHHWLFQQNQGLGQYVPNSIKNQPWNINPVSSQFNNWMGRGPWRSALGAPSWAAQTAGGAATAGAGAAFGQGCGCQ